MSTTARLPEAVLDRSDAPAAPWRLLSGLRRDGGWIDIEEHRGTYRQPPPAPGRAQRPIIDAVERSGLMGRGGAGFPTATKMLAVTSGAGRPVVVANGTEGEPASGKDRLLLARLPHLVIDGALIAAAAVGADRLLICIEESNSEALSAMRRALMERKAEGTIEIGLVATPPGYVSGEESALVNFLNGGSALPTSTPPRPFERGVANRPTLVHNVETLAHLTQIWRWGPQWFRSAGTDAEPGTALVTLSGAVRRAGIIEAEMGTTLRSIVAAADPASTPAAVLVGGFFGTWIPGSELDRPFSRQGLTGLDGSPGSGVVIVLPEGACGLAETARILNWYAAESAGQCGPCMFGLPAIATEAAALSRGELSAKGRTRLERWGSEVTGRGACKHPDGAVRLLRSALAVFERDIHAHLHLGPCAGAAGRSVIDVPGVAR